MLKNLVTSAVFAGFAAGLIAALLRIMLLVPVILEAEAYESGAKIHFESTISDQTETGHSHDEGVTADDTHAHGHDAAVSMWERNSQTVLWTLGTYIGFAFILVAGFGISQSFGIRVTARAGILWGAAGFVAIHLAPAAGLPPELPGAWAAGLFERQVWWVGTVGATIAGLASIAFGKNWIVWGAGIALIAAPHVIGAPHIAEFGGVVPPELAAHFVSLSLAAGAAGWVSLGLFAGYFWQKTNP